MEGLEDFPIAETKLIQLLIRVFLGDDQCGSSSKVHSGKQGKSIKAFLIPFGVEPKSSLATNRIQILQPYFPIQVPSRKQIGPDEEGIIFYFL
jgi:hypothetical protein